MLPSCIKDLAGPPEPPPPAQQAATLRLMDHILHATLLQVMVLFVALECKSPLQQLLAGFIFNHVGRGARWFEASSETSCDNTAPGLPLSD